MEKQIIKTTIPLSPSLINEYCKRNATGEKDIIFEFDISESSLTPAHILGYLANLKIDFRVTGFDSAFFLEYLKTPFLVGQSNLSRLHANMLMWNVMHELEFETIGDHQSLYESIPEEVIEQQMELLSSLPLFLIESAEMPGPKKAEVLRCDVKESDKVFEHVGVNFVHLIEFKEFLLKLLFMSVGDMAMKGAEDFTYYTHYFDKYIYGGDKLIQFFINNPENLLHDAINTMLTHDG